MIADVLRFETLLYLIVSLILYSIAKSLYKSIQYNRGKDARGCGDIKKYRHYDPIFGLDYVYAMVTALKEHRFLPFQKQLFAAQGVKTFEAKFFGMRMVYSSEVENMKAMSTSMWKDFGVTPIRNGNGAATPFIGHGTSTSDGEIWEYSRGLIKPYFDRGGYHNLGRLAVHTDRLLDNVPMDSSTFDLQPLLQRWVSNIPNYYRKGDLMIHECTPRLIPWHSFLIHQQNFFMAKPSILLRTQIMLNQPGPWST